MFPRTKQTREGVFRNANQLWSQELRLQEAGECELGLGFVLPRAEHLKS